MSKLYIKLFSYFEQGHKLMYIIKVLAILGKAINL